MLPVIQQVQTIMRKHGLEKKPLWNTEIGWWIDNKTKTKQLAGVTEPGSCWTMRRSSAYLARTFILSWPAGVSRVYWYSWDSLDMGLIRAGSLKLTPAALAFDTTCTSADWGLIKQCSATMPYGLASYCVQNLKRFWIVWAEDDVARNWTIPG